MGDQNTVLLEADSRHLLRRTGFGAPADKVETLTGMTRGQAADTLLAFSPSTFHPRDQDDSTLRSSWVKYMLKTKVPFQEKLVLFWHDHFATGYSKVSEPTWMSNQNKVLRQHCKGNFRDLLIAINRDAAMIEFLDTSRNHADDPNENYARELQELFALGVNDLNGEPNYTQDDIVQIARAFTGWDTTGRGEAVFHDYDHDYTDDYPERGPKTIYLGAHGFGPGGADFTQPGGEGMLEGDQVIDVLLQHRDSDNQVTAARYLARRLLTYFAHSTPTKVEIDAVVAASNFATTWELTPLLRAILVSDTFYATAAGPPYSVNSKKSVKWPIDFVVSTLRALGMKLTGRSQFVNYSSYTDIEDYLENMGQILFDPPSVFGWDWENGWVSSSTLLARYEFAKDLVSARGNGKSGFRPHKIPVIKELMASGATSTDTIVDTVTDILGVTDQISSDERTVFIDYLGGTGNTLDLNDYDIRNTKLHGLFALVMQSPAYQLH